METLLLYYGFSDFMKDASNTFEGEISYVRIGGNHFLIFERVEENYKLFYASYPKSNVIGKKAPEETKLLVSPFLKGEKEHREYLQNILDVD
ncbi:hypothetical protein [Aureivirga sp. CE67]|uniref:hypothetical protein n=1 Tax=Aureivirga sp. CE67 TaxID=1788983 RepID=UPI0018C9C8D4|nr:hypothetical protein [Aureivirga sp. CE67]